MTSFTTHGFTPGAVPLDLVRSPVYRRERRVHRPVDTGGGSWPRVSLLSSRTDRIVTRPSEPQAVTPLLVAWSAGDHAAFKALVPLVYAELRRQARRALRREPTGHTLQSAELVHEAYLRLLDQRRARWESRAQFFVVAAEIMRRILVDYARARMTAKRGGGARPLTLGDADVVESATPEVGGNRVDVLALDEALTRLAALDARKARLVELRYFAGLSIPEAAESLGVSAATVGREWEVARLWLRRELAR